MDCSQDCSQGSDFDDVGISDILDKLSLLNGKLAQHCLLKKMA